MERRLKIKKTNGMFDLKDDLEFDMSVRVLPLCSFDTRTESLLQSMR